MSRGFANEAGLGVYNHYGPRVVGEEDGGVIKTEGAANEYSIDLTGEFINKVIADGTSRSMMLQKLPAGSLISTVLLEVEEVFVVGGTSPTLEIGTEGSEATNGASASEAQLEALGLYDLTSTLAGTWAASLAAETQIGFALGGTTPTLGDGGKARLVIRYYKV
jgi:hypothetical protein